MAPPGQKPIDPQLHQYLAGYIDGEGCFQFRRTLEISITSIYPYTLKVFQVAYGGAINHRKGDVNRRTSYQWRIYGQGAMKVLEDVLPYLREKKVQALLCVAIRETPPGPEREGLMAQLKSMKRVEYL